MKRLIPVRRRHTLFCRILKGDVEEAKGIFKIKDTDTETKYTDHAIINYNNHDVDVTMFIQRRGKNYEKGVYPIKVFLEGELMAVTINCRLIVKHIHRV